jgi:hypothetical protein
MASDDAVFVETASHGAACGVAAEPRAIYVIFAHAPEEAGHDFRVDSCSGTRVHLSRTSPEPQGFEDVPARFVAQQLNGLAGMEVLRAVSANYPQQDDPENTHLLGLLDIKDFYHGGSVALYAHADKQSEVLLEIGDYSLLETREVGYEQAAAVVYTVVPGWYRLRLLNEQYAWMDAEQAGTYFDYSELPVNRLSYLTRSWSGFVWPDPGASLPVRYGAMQDESLIEFPAEIIETTEVGGTTWFRVNILAKDPCSNQTFGNSLGGWIPAYGARGEPNAWFWSRGC